MEGSKRMNKFLLMTIILLICIGLSGCNEISNTMQGEEDRFVGTWSGKGELGIGQFTYVFYSNFTCSVNEYNGTYELKEGNLTIYLLPDDLSYSYSFSDNDTKLTLTNVERENPIVLTKQ